MGSGARESSQVRVVDRPAAGDEGVSSSGPKGGGGRKATRGRAGQARLGRDREASQDEAHAPLDRRLDLGPEFAGEERPTPGAYLRAQRKRRGMSLDQLSIITKIPRRQLELLEEDRFGELPGMVFTKGFLRCCARALELDPDTVLGLFYEREREQLRARRRDATSGVPAVTGRGRAGSPAQRWLVRRLDSVTATQVLLWLVIALIVALVVLIAFTLASGQAETLMIRS